MNAMNKVAKYTHPEWQEGDYIYQNSDNEWLDEGGDSWSFDSMPMKRIRELVEYKESKKITKTRKEIEDALEKWTLELKSPHVSGKYFTEGSKKSFFKELGFEDV